METLSASILSYAVTVSYYMPSAAHGMYNIRYINYDLTAGKVLTLADVFYRRRHRCPPEIIRDYAVRMEASIGSTDITEIPCGGNFYLTPRRRNSILIPALRGGIVRPGAKYRYPYPPTSSRNISPRQHSVCCYDITT